MACVHYASIHLERDVYTALILLPVNIISGLSLSSGIPPPPPPPLFLDQTEAQRDEEKMFLETRPPLTTWSQGLNVLSTTAKGKGPGIFPGY